VSVTVTLKALVVDRPELSVAVQLTVVAPIENGPGDPGVQTTDGVGSTLSVAETSPEKLNDVVVPVAETVWSLGTVRFGATLSTAETLNDFVILFDAASVAVQLTVVSPSGKSCGAPGVQTTVADETLSVAETRPEKSNDVVVPVAVIVWSPGMVRSGGVVSVTVTVNDPESVRPAPSVAVQLTVVGPSGNGEPGVQVTEGVEAASLAETRPE
jgi:hypothetical protein